MKKIIVSKVVADCNQALSIKYNTMVYEKKSCGQDITVLSLGEAFFDIPLYDFKALPYPDVYHYSHSRGVLELRKKIAEYFIRKYGVNFCPEKEIIITAGSKAAIYMAMRAILNPGDQVLIPEPSWVSYPEQVKLCYAQPINIPYYESIENYEKYITEKTRLIIINNPNNPTGKIYSEKELLKLYSLATKYNLSIISDEAYSDFVENSSDFISFGKIDSQKKRTIIVNSMSKNFGISGWRIGYLISNQEWCGHILKLNQHIITCAPTILEWYVYQNFDSILECTRPQICNLLKKRERVKKFMDQNKLQYLTGEVTFYFFVSISPSKLRSDVFCTRLLNEENICVVPGIGYGPSCDGYVRVSIGSESDQRIFNALLRLQLFIEKTAGNDGVSVAKA